MKQFLERGYPGKEIHLFCVSTLILIQWPCILTLAVKCRQYISGFSIVVITLVSGFSVAEISPTSSVRIISENTTCDSVTVKFLQVTVGRLDAGIRTFEAFRLLSDGTLHQAVWNNAQVLLEVATPVNIGGESYIAAEQLLAKHQGRWWSRLLLGLGSSTPVRRALTLDLARLSPDGVRFKTLEEIPEDINALLAEWRLAAPRQSPKTGYYVWTAPYARIGEVDLEFARGNCQSVVARAVLEALETGRLSVPVSQDIEVFLSGENKFRNQFGASFTWGYVRFGVVIANPPTLH